MITFQKRAGIIITGLCLGIAPPAVADLERMPISVDAVADHLEGVMDTSAQAAANPDFVSVQMTTCRVTVTEPAADSVYLYQEQALSDSLDEPYRQRFLQIAPGDGLRVESHTFKPDAPEQWVGFCNDPSGPVFDHRASNDRLVPTAALGEQICTVALRPSPLGMVGSTPSGGCPASVRGAVSITNVVVLHVDGMDTWDRGFDAAGNQVWGAEDEPYQYRWVAP
ncbi:MAG: chromophore lyase CpcT/CpeT [Cyanobacteria bacterium P01_G01_bin.38]